MSRRFNLQMEGDDSILLIHCKSVEMLQKHAENLANQELTAHFYTQEQQKFYKDTLGQTYRDTREAMPIQQLPQNVEAPVYPHGIPPIGNPTPLNPEIITPAT